MAVEKDTNIAKKNAKSQALSSREDLKLRSSQRIQIFQTGQKTFATLGIRPDLVLQPYPFNSRILLGFLILGSSNVSCIVYTIHDAQSFSEYTQCSYICSAGCATLFALAIILLNARKVFELINDLENFVNIKFKYCATKSIFGETNETVEKWSKILLFVFVILPNVCVALPWLVYTYFLYFTTDLGSNAFQSPVPTWFPFNWRVPFGFLLAFTIEISIYIYGSSLLASIIILSTGIYQFVIAFSKCIRENLFSISQNTKVNAKEEKVLDQLIEFIEFHSSVMQFINDFSEIYQNMIAIVFLWSLVTICGSLLMFQMQIINHNENVLVSSVTMIEVTYAFGTIFITCELCQRVNLAFDECSDIIDQFDWYLLPAKIQRIMPMVIHFTQQPIEIKGFGSASANRDTFKRVVKTAFSYFMVLRQFYN